MLEFARDPALTVSLFVLFAGIVWRLVGIFRLPKKRDLSEPRSTALVSGAPRGIVTRMWPRREIRYRAFEIWMRQIEATGADTAVTSCANCRQTFDDEQAHFHWDRKMESLLEMVADNLAPARQ